MVAKRENDYAKALQICLRMVLDEGFSIDDVLARFPAFADDLRADLVTSLWLNGQQGMYKSRPGFISSSHSRLMRQIKSGNTKKVGKSRRSPFMRPVFRLAFSLLLVFSILLSSTGVASAGALPGDALYPVKLSWEDARIFLNQDMAKDVRLHLRFADKRIGEAIILVNRASFDHIELAFENYRHHTANAYMFLITLTEQGQARDLVDEFANMVSEHIPILQGMQHEIPVEVASSIDPIVESLESELSSLDKGSQETDEAKSPDEGPATINTESQPNAEESPGFGGSNGEGYLGTENGINSEGHNESGNEENNADAGAGEGNGEGEGGNESGEGMNDGGENQGGGNAENNDNNPSDGNQGKGNDGEKDNNPNDGNQGIGNDDKVDNPNKGPGNNSGQGQGADNTPSDGNQGIGNDDKVDNPNKGPGNNSGQGQGADNTPPDGNQGGGNDEAKDTAPDDGNQGGGNDNKDKNKNK